MYISRRYTYPGKKSNLPSGFGDKKRSRNVIFITILSQLRFYPGWQHFLCCHSIVFPFLIHFFNSSEVKTKKKIKEPLRVVTMSIGPNPKMKTLKMKYGLFRLTQQHHKKCLRNLFLKHYTPLVKKGFKPNKHWATHLPTNVMNDLRLHLSWVRGGDVTATLDRWTDRTKDCGHLSQIKSVVIPN